MLDWRLRSGLMFDEPTVYVRLDKSQKLVNFEDRLNKIKLRDPAEGKTSWLSVPIKGQDLKPLDPTFPIMQL